MNDKNEQNTDSVRYIVDDTNYTEVQLQLESEITKRKEEHRFVPFNERKATSAFNKEHIKLLCHGKYKMLWRGMQIMKDPLDYVIYQQFLWHEKPKTIFEIGAYSGANAVWMADTLDKYNLECQIYSVDIDLSLLHPEAKKCPTVTFLKGDAHKISEVFPESLLKTLPHPWMISEDAHVDLYGCMAHFHQYMKPGDYFIIEDTNAETPAASGQGLLDCGYELWGLKKHNILGEFVTKHSELYKVDTFYTDYFGYNSTYNWNGFIKRVA